MVDVRRRAQSLHKRARCEWHLSQANGHSRAGIRRSECSFGSLEHGHYDRLTRVVCACPRSTAVLDVAVAAAGCGVVAGTRFWAWPAAGHPQRVLPRRRARTRGAVAGLDVVGARGLLRKHPARCLPRDAAVESGVPVSERLSKSLPRRPDATRRVVVDDAGLGDRRLRSGVGAVASTPAGAQRRVVSDDVAIRVEDVSKRFKLYRSGWSRVAEWLALPGRRAPEESWALRSVSFAVRRGECVGIIGPNGAGKSTLLKILTGAMWPSHGQVEVRGRVLSLIELGAGFNPELTGRQNVEYSARLLGLPPRLASGSLDEVERFAELGEYFDRPVKLYSSGMFVRLAFSLFS